MKTLKASEVRQILKEVILEIGDVDVEQPSWRSNYEMSLHYHFLN